MLPYSKGDARDWARQHLRGVCNVIIPSFTSDLSDINETGIRLDVEREIALGFSGFLLVSETATTFDEYVRFAATAADEADGRLVVIHQASFNTLDENVQVARRATDAGATVALLSYPPCFYPMSIEEVEIYTRSFCEQVDLGVILFPVPLWGFERLHAASLPIDMLERLVDDLPNIVAIKAEGGYPTIAGFVEAWNRLHERVVVTMPLEHDAIPLATLLPTGIRWHVQRGILWLFRTLDAQPRLSRARQTRRCGSIGRSTLPDERTPRSAVPPAGIPYIGWLGSIRRGSTVQRRTSSHAHAKAGARPDSDPARRTA